jgi:hypothetical protein
MNSIFVRLLRVLPQSFLSVLVAIQSACFVGPRNYRLDFPSDGAASCGSVILPSEWSFSGPPGPHATPDRVSFEIRLLPSDPTSFLLAGARRDPGALSYSDQIFRLSPSPGARWSAAAASLAEWAVAHPATLARTPVVPDAPGNPVVPPHFEFRGRAYALSGPVFWQAAEATRLSPSASRLLALSYTPRQGVFRPRAYVHFDLFSTATGQKIWSARGEAPSLPPFAQFEAIAWLSDHLLLLPHNSAGTHLDACLISPVPGDPSPTAPST